MSWPNVALAEVSEINPKGPRSGEILDEQLIDFVPMASVSERGTMQVNEQKRYSEVKKGFTAFRSSDVLLAKITPCYENNKIVKARIESGYAFGSTEFHVIRALDRILDADYLTHFLRQDWVRRSGERRMTGSGGQRRVPKSFLAELKIPLPPLEEQKRIAGILDQADALRRLRTRALEKLNTLGQAIFYEMFGTFDAGFGNWPAIELNSAVTDAKIGLVRGAAEQGDDLPIPYLRMDTIGMDGSLSFEALRRVNASARERAEFSLEIGDFILNTRNSRELVGKTAVVRDPFDGVYNNNILRLRFDGSLQGAFLDSFLRTPAGKRALDNQKSGTTSVFAIYQKSLLKMLVPAPAAELQTLYSEKLIKLHIEKAAYSNAIQKAETLFTSLQHRAFRGDL